VAVSNSTHISKLMQDQGFRQRVQVVVVGEGKKYSDFPWAETWMITDQIVPLVAQEEDVVYAYTYNGGYDLENITDAVIVDNVVEFLPVVRPGLTPIPPANGE